MYPIIKSLLYFLGIIFLFLSDSAALSPNSDIEVLKSTMPWIELIDDPNQSEPQDIDSLQGKYWLNNFEMRVFFTNYLESDSFLNSSLLEFKNNLEKAHQIAAAGKNGERFYKRGRKSPFVQGGKFRDKNGSEDYKLQFLLMVDVARKLNTKYDLNDPYPLIVDANFDGAIKIELTEVPQNSWPSNKYVNQPNFEQSIGFIQHPHPDWNLYSDDYLRVIYGALKDAYENKDKQLVVIRSAAKFFQYGINLMPFPEINKSFLMNIVNLMLKIGGLNGIPHKLIDFAAFSLQPETFYYYFLEEVKITNPDLIIPDTFSKKRVEKSA